MSALPENFSALGTGEKVGLVFPDFGGHPAALQFGLGHFFDRNIALGAALKEFVGLDGF